MSGEDLAAGKEDNGAGRREAWGRSMAIPWSLRHACAPTHSRKHLLDAGEVKAPAHAGVGRRQRHQVGGSPGRDLPREAAGLEVRDQPVAAGHRQGAGLERGDEVGGAVGAGAACGAAHVTAAYLAGQGVQHPHLRQGRR